MLHLLGKRGQCGNTESCILQENGFIARALQRSLFAVCKFRTASEEHCGWGYDQCVQTLLLDVVAPKPHQNDHSYSLCELKLWTFESSCKNFAWWACTQRTLKNHRTIKMEGWALAQDNTVLLWCCRAAISHANRYLVPPLFLFFVGGEKSLRTKVEGSHALQPRVRVNDYCKSA